MEVFLHWHRDPINPDGHRQEYEKIPSVQSAPFKQGLGEQSSPSFTEIKTCTLTSLVDIGQKRAYGGSGLYQKFYCILLLPISGGILQLVYSTGAPPMGP